MQCSYSHQVAGALASARPLTGVVQDGILSNTSLLKYSLLSIILATLPERKAAAFIACKEFSAEGTPITVSIRASHRPSTFRTSRSIPSSTQ